MSWQNSLTGSVDVAVVLGMSKCDDTNGCSPPSEIFGTILYNGSYSPQFSDGAMGKPPNQNFTVTVPSTFAGKVQLNLAHFTMVGVSVNLIIGISI